MVGSKRWSGVRHGSFQSPRRSRARFSAQVALQLIGGVAYPAHSGKGSNRLILDYDVPINRICTTL